MEVRHTSGHRAGESSGWLVQNGPCHRQDGRGRPPAQGPRHQRAASRRHVHHASGISHFLDTNKVNVNESWLIRIGLLLKGDIREHGRSSDHDRREGSSFRQVRVGWCGVKMVRACFFPCVETLKRGWLIEDDSSH